MNIPIIDALFHTTGSMPGEFELQVNVGRQQVEHLVSRGATRLIFASPPPREVDASILADRARGVRETAARHGVELTTLEVPGPHETAPPPDFAGLLVAESRVAVCAFNDLTALAVQQHARAIGLHAPQDFAIIGVDDIAAAAYTTPTLSSVRFEIVEHIGAIATQTIAFLEGEPEPLADPRPLSRVIGRESS
jgi:DNA-binding LacI/PurR family transcriptional regulator